MESLSLYVNALFEVIKGLVPIAGVVIAWMGLNTWKRQIKGTDKYKVASELLLETYRVREGMRVVRTPLIEYSPDSNSDESEEMKNFLGYVDALEKRWKQLLEPSARLSLSSLKAEVHLGKDVKGSVDELLKLIRELQVAYQMHIEMRRPGSGLEDDNFYRENRKTLWSRPSDDSFSEKVTISVEKIENLTRAYL